MQIVIHCGGMPFNGATIPSGESLGGSESAAYFMARELRKLDHQVVVFTTYKPKDGEPTAFDGVNYSYMGRQDVQTPLGDVFHTIMRVPHDVCIVQRAPMAFYRPLNTKLNIWWLHDIALIRQANQVIHHMPFIDQILTVSNWHKNQVSKVYDIPPEMITATTNGVDYELFDKFKNRTLDQREPKSLVFAARPERGLREIIREGGLAELLPDCKFHVCTYKNVAPHMQGLYNYCWKRCDMLPNVTNHGFLGKHDLYDLISRCMLYVYPTCFEDTSNIMILEANAVGTPYVAPQDLAALPETGSNAGMFWVPISQNYQYGDPERSELKDADLKKFADTISHIFNSLETQWKPMHRRALEKKQSWADAAIQWDALFKKLLADRCDNEDRIFHHLEKMSDVYFVRDRYKDRMKKNYHFIYSGEYKKHYDNYYEYEKKRGVNYGPESLQGNPRFEHTARIVNELKPQTILDYGCAHGHYVLNLKKRWPHLKIDGIDLNQRNIDIAKKWLSDDFPEAWRKQEIMFLCGDVHSQSTQAVLKGAKYDLIIAAEILEHVAEPAALCEKLHEYLAPGGWMLITVPYGPWEAIGYLEHPGWRAHIHHFERQDLMDIFAGQNDYRLQAVPHSDHLGHYILIYRPSDKPLGKIDYNRKITQQAPRETVSACLIVKNGEHDLGRTLKSIQPIYNELIIGIDETTTDETKRIAELFNANWFYIKSPLEIGFDKARNETIKRAKMDWIFWIDSDEILENAQNLNKYLRPNVFNGYGLKQHHFAVEPEGILKTDFPCRLFRNNKSLKFYGHVHEHPETEMNKGPGKVYIIPDVAITHTGYGTEITRRKRFERNFPLMQIEREKNPDRNLSRFLWLRDLVQLCKYETERNGAADIKKYTTEAIETWREIISQESPNIRLILDSLPYYSDACVLKNQGQAIEFHLEYGSSKFKPMDKKPIPLHGYFDSENDIKNLVNVLINENIKYYNERYY
jgi:2-polyprenyl-3-methyl-5-hydroxy-6-metoxy-1,4-benzoquinol methylase/glycosyltransferase involved in cell wall biosynthesis